MTNPLSSGQSDKFLHGSNFMKIQIPIYWDFDKQEESEVIVNVPNEAVKDVLMSFLYSLDFPERREWLKNNVPEINLNIPKELF
tara:strand:+ start:66 stop:317 length:252 start_codon:yes stop_codon:yes gene_type:complete